MTPKSPSIKVFALLFASALGLTIILSVVGHLLEPSLAGTDAETVRRLRPYVIGAFFVLFLVMAFSAVPVAIRVFFRMFTKLQQAVGNENHPIVRTLIGSQDRIGTVLIWSYWALYVIGLAIAAPYLSEMWRE